MSRKTRCFSRVTVSPENWIPKTFHKCLYNLLYNHHQGHVYHCRAADIPSIIKIPSAALALQVVTMETLRLTCEERLFETQDICTLLKCVIHSVNHQTIKFIIWYEPSKFHYKTKLHYFPRCSVKSISCFTLK